MTVRSLYAGVVLAALMAVPTIAVADTPPAPSAPQIQPAPPAGVVMPDSAMPDPGRLSLAREIVAIALPPERASAIMNRLLDSMMRPMQAQIQTQLHTSDPGLRALVSDFIKSVTDSGRTTLVQTLPDLTESMAHAYARQFSREDLAQILAFAHTPAGSRYLSRASELMQDPDVQAYYGRLFPAIQASQAPLLAEFKRKVGTYLAAHPDVAKAMAQPK